MEEQPHWVQTLILTAGELAFALVAIPLYLFLVLPNYPEGALPGFSPVIAADANPALAILATLGVLAVALGAMFLLPWLFGYEPFRTESVDLMVESYTPLDFVFIFAAAGFAEEFLFRVVLTDAFGIVIASLLFTAIHIAYWRKPLILVDVFALSLLLGLLYLYTKSLLLCAIAHGLYNFLLSVLLQKGILPIEHTRA